MVNPFRWKVLCQTAWVFSVAAGRWLASLAGIIFPDGRGVAQSFGLRCPPMMSSVGQQSVPSSSVLSFTAYSPPHGRDAVVALRAQRPRIRKAELRRPERMSRALLHL